jgi:hypothetical protein
VPHPYHRVLLPQVLDDLRALAEINDTLVDTALQTITDVAMGRKAGKVLGARHVSGDLTGCRRLRFDVPGHRTQRFRVVHRLRPDDTTPDTVEVIAVGPRGGHAVYRAAADRLTDT